MKKRMMTAILLTALTVGGLLTGCGNAAEVEDMENPVYTGATQTDYPPFCFLDDEGNLKGFEVEFLQEISNRMEGASLEIKGTDWDSMFLNIESNKLDFAADEIAITEKREEKYLFSEPYIEIQSVIVTQKGRTDIQTLDDLVGLNVVASLDSYGELIQQYNDTHEDQIPVTFLSSDVGTTEIVTQIAQGKYDAYVNDPVMLNSVIQDNGLEAEVVGEPITSEYAAIVFPKNEKGEQLKALIDPIIKEMKEDGTLSELCKKWTGGDYIPE